MDKRIWAEKILHQLQQYMDLTHWDIRIEWVEECEEGAKWGLVRLDTQPLDLWNFWGQGRATLFLKPSHPNLEECLWRLLTHIICRPYAGADTFVNWEGCHLFGDQMGDIFTDLLYRRREMYIPAVWKWVGPNGLLRWLMGATAHWQDILGLNDWLIHIHWGQRPWEWWERKQMQADSCITPLPPKLKLIAEHHITNERGKRAQIWYDLSLMDGARHSLHSVPVHELLHIKAAAAGVGHISIMQLTRIFMRMYGVLIPTVVA